jgi:hypothetical protein
MKGYTHNGKDNLIDLKKPEPFFRKHALEELKTHRLHLNSASGLHGQ